MSWIRIHGEELRCLQSRFALPTDATAVEAAYIDAPFYSNGGVMKLSVDNGVAYMVAAGRGDLSTRSFYPLRGSSADIHAANEAAGLVVTPYTVLDYVRFFTGFLVNDDGQSFALAESLEGYGLINADKPDQGKPSDMRLAYCGLDPEGDRFGCRGYMVFDGILFDVTLSVDKIGHVSMVDDEPLGCIVRLQ